MKIINNIKILVLFLLLPILPCYSIDFRDNRNQYKEIFNKLEKAKKYNSINKAFFIIKYPIKQIGLCLFISILYDKDNKKINLYKGYKAKHSNSLSSLKEVRYNRLIKYNKIKIKIRNTFKKAYVISKKYNTNLRAASYIAVLNRLNLYKDQGDFNFFK